MVKQKLLSFMYVDKDIDNFQKYIDEGWMVIAITKSHRAYNAILEKNFMSSEVDQSCNSLVKRYSNYKYFSKIEQVKEGAIFIPPRKKIEVR
ncbi:MAG TPA: DUF2674 domain-containing protein [Candidatus Megaira endosymbiont of Hartmannula sinica]|nr:DUF2674 domain-containing protein [Candidatus Megaera endosymbiont of Hartmannula sinica]